MNGINNHQVAQAVRMLQEMQGMASQARGGDNGAVPGVQQPSFANAMQQAVEQVNQLQTTSAGNTEAFLRGEDIELTEVMVSTQKSRVAFEATKAVRNQLVEAYRDIFNMPV